MIKKRMDKLFDLRDQNNGFSLIELVVAISIMIVLTALGLIGYRAIARHAEMSAVSSAASDTFTASYVYEQDELANTDYKTAETEWNNTKSDKTDIEVSVNMDSDGKITVKAWDSKGYEIVRS